jgi:hypothetical protein
LKYYRVKTLAGWNIQAFQPAKYLIEELLLCNLRLLWDNQRHDQIHDRDAAKAGEKRQHGQQANNGRIDTKVFSQPCADSRDHAVGRAASQLLVIGIHDIALLSMISM